MSAEAEIKQFIDRVLRLKEEQDTLSEDIREVYAEAKGRGYDKTAMGQVVAHLRKVDKLGSDAIAERETIFGMYLGAYETGTSVATHTHEAKNGYAAEKGVDREARRKQRMSESMDDSIALSAEAVALGLIDPKAHEETVRIADAVARKFGNGPLNEQIDPDTGEITNSPETANEAAGKRPVPSMSGSTAPAPVQRSDASNSAKPLGVTVVGTESGTVTNSETTPDPRPLTAADGQPRIPSSSPGCVKSDRSPPVVGQGCESGGIYTGSKEEQAVDNFEPPAFLQSKPLKTARDYRPHCQKPDACGASGLQHCYSCSKLIPEKSEVA